MSTEAEPILDMRRVTPRELWEHLDRWPLVASVSKQMKNGNKGGHYSHTGYFSVLEVKGTTLVPDESNLLAVIGKSPTKSDGIRQHGYFINLNARPEA